MPQLHANQIQWSAPEAQKVSLAKPDYSYLAGALDNLANAGNAIADSERKRLDDALVNDMNEQLNLANQDIENARSADADFDSLGEKALSRFQATLGMYDEATRRRFLEANPHYLDNTQLAISEKILTRKRDIFEADVENSIPLWTSQAMKIGTPQARQDVIHKIQDRLGNISYETTVENFIFKANQIMDNATIATLINKGTAESLKEAETFIKNPETNVTIDGYKRVAWAQQIREGYKQLEKLKNASEDPASSNLLEIYSSASRLGYTTAADSLYKQIVNTDNPIIEVPQQLVGVKDEKGNPIPVYIDVHELSSLQRADLGLKLKKYKDLNPNAAYEEAKYVNAVNDAVADYTMAAENKSSKQDEAVSLLSNLISDTTFFNGLPEGTRVRVAEIREKHIAAQAEAIRGHKEFIDTYPLAAKSIGVPSQQVGRMIMSLGEAPELSPAKSMQERIMKSSMNGPLDKGSVVDVVTELTSGGGMTDAAYVSPVGQMINQATKGLKDNFYTDVEDNTVGDFGINTIAVLQAYKNIGKLDGTRLGGDEERYAQVLGDWMTLQKANGTVNTRITDETEQNVDLLYNMLLGDSKRTEQEAQVIKEAKEWTRLSQAPRGSTAFGRAMFTPTPDSTYNVTGSNPTPVLQKLKIGNELFNKRKEIKKAFNAASIKD